MTEITVVLPTWFLVVVLAFWFVTTSLSLYGALLEWKLRKLQRAQKGSPAHEEENRG